MSETTTLLPAVYPLKDSQELTLQVRAARKQGIGGWVDYARLSHQAAIMERHGQALLRHLDTMIAVSEKHAQFLEAQKKELEALARLNRSPEPPISVYQG